jgi:hypothetical protein
MSGNVRTISVRIQVFYIDTGDVAIDFAYITDLGILTYRGAAEMYTPNEQFVEWCASFGRPVVVDEWKYVWSMDKFQGHSPVPPEVFIPWMEREHGIALGETPAPIMEIPVTGNPLEDHEIEEILFEHVELPVPEENPPVQSQPEKLVRDEPAIPFAEDQDVLDLRSNDSNVRRLARRRISNRRRYAERRESVVSSWSGTRKETPGRVPRWNKNGTRKGSSVTSSSSVTSGEASRLHDWFDNG